MHKLKDLLIWQKTVDLALLIYKATESFPTEEKFGLASQIRKSAISIPSNISECAGRNGNKEFNQFLGIARGSSYELETQLIIADKLNLLHDEIAKELLNKLTEIQKMSYSLMQKLRIT
ncbi:MAG: four helix bundle protein [Flavobacteriales bacterium]|nr:four helix bundle protein [Flavobacteriales bacterium]